MSPRLPCCFLAAGGLMMNLRAATVLLNRRGPRERDTLMQQQGPNGMGGPLRGTSVWWHGRRDEVEPDDRPPRHDPGIRTELVERVRREIAAGAYDTPERWEAALDRLLERLHGD